MAENPLRGRTNGSPERPAYGLTFLAIFLCFSLSMAGLSMLIEGLGRQDFGWVRHFGAVSLADRPVAFAAVTVSYLAATIVPAWGALVLIARVRRSWSAKS